MTPTKESAKNDSRYIDRPFNIRPICFWAFFVVLTIVVCIAFQNRPWWVGVYFVVLIGMFYGLQFVRPRDAVLQFFGTSRMNFLFTIGLCLAVALSFSITSLLYTNQKSFAGYDDLSGVVESFNLDSDGSGWFILGGAKFGSSAVSGKVAVYVNNPNAATADAVKSTYRVSLYTQLRTANANDYNINNGIKYTANPGASESVVALGADGGVRSVVLRYCQNFLRAHMASERNADLMYAMLLGDRSTLDGDISESFSLTGLAHVLSVSGLHVGILVGFLMWLLKFLRVNRRRQVPIIAAVLAVYCYLCGFRYSILRASIMFLVLAVRRAFLRSNDLLSSVSLAGIVVLVLFPFSINSASFQLSFACMLGIALFALPLSNFFEKKAKLPHWLASAFSMYFATFLGCLPLMIKYFGFVSVVGVFTNLLFLPLMVLAFQISFLAVVTWVAFPLLYVVNIVLDVVISVTQWIASLPFSYVSLAGGGGYWFLLYYVGLVLATRFIFFRGRWKYSAAAILILIYAVSVF